MNKLPTKLKIIDWTNYIGGWDEDDLKACGIEITEELLDDYEERWVGMTKYYGDKAREEIRKRLPWLLIANKFLLAESTYLKGDDSDYITREQKWRWLIDHGKSLKDKDWDKIELDVSIKIKQ